MPTPFIPKRLSRVALSCRNPLYSGMMLMFLAALCYGEVTLGRALFLGLMIIGTLLGSTFEERQLQRTNREFFERYRTLNPNRYFPRLKIIFGSKEIINEFTK
jgi:protein-S-isoprenylcysteine O-methyltransferase Ste14